LLSFVIICFGILNAVHNFTINGQEEVTVAIGDDMLYDFDFESVMSNAGYSISIDIPLLEIPDIEIPFSLFQDGLGYDETGFDGHFTGTRECEMSFPSSVPVTITLTDGGVSDSVIIHYTALNTSFSISGSVQQENSMMNLPVPSPLLYVNYNSDDFTMVELMTCVANFFDPMPAGEYLVMEFGSMFGTYTVHLPEEIPNVTCAVNVYSYLDVQGEGTQTPPQQVVTVNGSVTGINFLYPDLQGGIDGTVVDGDGNPVGYAAFYITSQDDPEFEDYFLTGADGSFSRGLADGTYNYTVVAVGFDTFEDTFVVSGDYLTLDIVLNSSNAAEDNVQAPTGLKINSFPNPFSNSTILSLNSDKSRDVTIGVYDVKGRRISQIYTGKINAGFKEFSWNAEDSPSGMYFWRVVSNGIAATQKILLVK
jgi:hypothetical protein